MASDLHSVLVGETWRKAGMVAKASGSAITAGTVNYYLKALTGANAGKWWKNSDQTWAAVETANAMTHQADGCWTIELAATPFTADIIYLEYAKESGDLHVAGDGRLLRGEALTDTVQGNAIADCVLGRNIAGGSSTGRTVSQALYALRNKWSTTAVAGYILVYGTDDTTESWRAALTSDAAGEPITVSDPT